MKAKSARRRESKVLDELARAMRWTNDAHGLLQAVAEAIAGGRSSRDVFVYEFDLDANDLVLVGGTESPAALHAGTLRVPYGDGVTGWVAASRESYVVHRDPTSDPRFLPYPGIGEERYGAIYSVPIVSVRDELLGCITVWAASGHSLDEYEVPLVERVAAFIAAPLENARLRESDARRAAAFRAISVLGEAVASDAHAMHVTELATELARDISLADIAITFVTDQEAADRVVVKFAPTQARHPPTGVVGEPRRVILEAEQAVRHGRMSWRQASDAITLSLHAAGWAILAMPLRVGVQDLGILALYQSARTRFSAAETAGVAAIANQVAVATRLSIVREEKTAGNALNWFIRDLAFGRGTADERRRRARDLGLAPAESYVFLSVEVTRAPAAPAENSTTDPIAARLPAWLRQVRTLPAATLYATMQHQTIAVVPWESVDRPVEDLRSPLESLCASVMASTGASLTIGVSRPAAGVDDFGAALSEAREAMAVGSAIDGRSSVFTFDDVGHDVLLNRVSGSVPPRDRYAIAISRIAEYDRVKGTDLLETVAAFLHLRTQSAAARHLFVHRNTLNQRLERASELGGLDLMSPAEWFPLQLALKMHQVRASSAMP